jgi:4-alpha-glucanotransferase
MLVILPFQDWISINGKYHRTDANEERINIPSDPHHFWCYRMHLSIEDLLDCKDLNHKILEMSNNSGRNVKM